MEKGRSKGRRREMKEEEVNKDKSWRKKEKT